MLYDRCGFVCVCVCVWFHGELCGGLFLCRNQCLVTVRQLADSETNRIQYAELIIDLWMGCWADSLNSGQAVHS